MAYSIIYEWGTEESERWMGNHQEIVAQFWELKDAVGFQMLGVYT